MNSQAAQTMPELPPATAFLHNMAHNPLYTADQMHQYARDYAAMLAAARAASGVHPDALPDGTLSKSTAKRVTALAAASVSERARQLLAREVDADAVATPGLAIEAEIIRSGKSNSAFTDAALRAIEQALTQQRGECEDARKFHRLAQLLDGFDFRLGRNALMPPATYLDSVEITCEFQPGIGQSVIDAIVDVLATEKRND